MISWVSYNPEGFCIVQVQYKIICEIIINPCHLYMVKVPMDLKKKNREDMICAL